MQILREREPTGMGIDLETFCSESPTTIIAEQLQKELFEAGNFYGKIINTKAASIWKNSQSLLIDMYAGIWRLMWLLFIV